jgi:hypothetical protein
MESTYRSLLASGKATPAQIDTMRNERRHKDNYSLCRKLLLSRMYERDDTVGTQCELILSAAASLDVLLRREEAIHLLTERRFLDEDRYSDDEDAVPSALDASSYTIALAKILFKQDSKERALALTLSVCDAAATDPTAVHSLDASDAFYLSGWINIHNDDHTEAYRVWKLGSDVLPDSVELQRQNKKRVCWDVDDAAETLLPGLVGASPIPALADLEPFAVPEGTPCPALSLFAPASQNRNLVWRSKSAVLTADECANVLSHVDEYVEAKLGGVWGTVRKSSVKTTDVAVEDIAPLRPWLRSLLETRLWPLVHAAYPELADGSSTVSSEGGASRMRIHDAFIVRYDADCDKSFHLPEHSDTSAVSFTIALNESSEFEGGGTWFEALGSKDGEGRVVDAEIGRVCAFAGPMRHAGYPITSGVRMILVLFTYVEGFHYGPYVSEYTESILAAGGGCAGSCGGEGLVEGGVKPSGDKVGGYVVYRETVELSNMLGRIEKKS